MDWIFLIAAVRFKLDDNSCETYSSIDAQTLNVRKPMSVVKFMDRTIPFSFKFSFFFLVFVSKQIACLFASIILCSPFFASNSNCKLNDIYRYRFVKDTLLPIETKMKEIVIGSLRMFTKQFLIHDNMRDSNGFVAVCSVSQVLFRLRRAIR